MGGFFHHFFELLRDLGMLQLTKVGQSVANMDLKVLGSGCGDGRKGQTGQR